MFWLHPLRFVQVYIHPLLSWCPPRYRGAFAFGATGNFFDQCPLAIAAALPELSASVPRRVCSCACIVRLYILRRRCNCFFSECVR
jgi:hypothetical protein